MSWDFSFFPTFELKLKHQPFGGFKPATLWSTTTPLASWLSGPWTWPELYHWLSWVSNLETPFRLGNLASSIIMWVNAIINPFLYLCILHYLYFSREPQPQQPLKQIRQEWLTKNVEFTSAREREEGKHRRLLSSWHCSIALSW